MTRREVRANSKMQDLEEFRRWHAEGQTYAWMVEEYKRKYNIETSVAMFTNFATRLGLPKRSRKARSSTLPWVVKREHSGVEIDMLRFLAREQEGLSVPVSAAPRLAAWKEYLTERKWVVHYEPDTDEGSFTWTLDPALTPVSCGFLTPWRASNGPDAGAWPGLAEALRGRQCPHGDPDRVQQSPLSGRLSENSL